MINKRTSSNGCLFHIFIVKLSFDFKCSTCLKRDYSDDKTKYLQYYSTRAKCKIKALFLLNTSINFDVLQFGIRKQSIIHSNVYRNKNFETICYYKKRIIKEQTRVFM